jgi:hypothetical protein
MIVEWMFTSEAIKMTKDEMEPISIFRSALPVYSSYPKDCNLHTTYIQIEASYGDSKQSPCHHFAFLESWIMWKVYTIGKFKGRVFIYTIGLFVNNINTNIK